MKFLVDVGVGRGVENFLRASGFDVKAVRDVDPRSEDTEILQMAVNENRMIITMDKDFGDLIYRSGRRHSGILLSGYAVCSTVYHILYLATYNPFAWHRTTINGLLH